MMRYVLHVSQISKETSAIARCTGRFFRRLYTTRPKISPKTQNRMPIMRSLWPLTPRNCTWARSGSLKLASPAPGSSGALAKALPPGHATSAAAASILVIKGRGNQVLRNRRRMGRRATSAVFCRVRRIFHVSGAAGQVPENGVRYRPKRGAIAIDEKAWTPWVMR